MKALFAKIMGVGSAVWNFYAPVLTAMFTQGTAALLPIALEVARELSATSKTNEEKRNAALSRLKREAKAMGVSATESILRFTIESAVQRLKV